LREAVILSYFSDEIHGLPSMGIFINILVFL